ncbi:MAG: replicative DNA helicase [Phycisphaerae bacterium]|nr:replicative DNA helicase [Phycisphaerae bacterium]
MGETAFDRQLPHSLEAEQALLGSMLLDEGAVAEAISLLKNLGADVFFHERHRKLYEQIIRLYDASKPLDPIVVHEQLRQEGLLDELGGLDFLGQIVSSVPSANRVLHYGTIVRDKCLLRQLINATHRVLEDAFDDRRPVAELLDDVEREIFNVTEQRVTGGQADMRELLHDFFKQLEQRDEGMKTGLATGYFELDDLTCGLQPAELIIIAARPSMGKTALGLNIAEYMAIDERKHVLFFSLEMSKQQLVQRILCSRARVDAYKIRRGRVSHTDVQHLQHAANEASDAALLVDDTSDLGILELRARARLVHRRRPLDAIFVDYLQLMRGPKAESRQIEVAEISRGLKALAKELNVPVIAMAQLNRNPEDRGGKPRMSDLRESGAIEQDADVITLLHRDAYHRDVSEQAADDENLAELIVAKQRNGPVGTVTLHFSRQYTRFDNHSPMHEASSNVPSGGAAPF